MYKWLILLGAAALIGCSNKTETGYEPRRLGDSETVQRGYYATPFSPQAREAEAERAGGDMGARRPEWRPGVAP